MVGKDVGLARRGFAPSGDGKESSFCRRIALEKRFNPYFTFFLINTLMPQIKAS